MYEIRKLKAPLRLQPVSLSALRAMLYGMEEGELSEVTGIPMECGSLGEVAAVMAHAHDRQTLEDAATELESQLRAVIDAEGIARHGDYVIRHL